MENYKLFQIHYKPEQIEQCYSTDLVEHIYNPVPEQYNFKEGYFLFENKIIIDRITKDINAKYVGVLSHKHFDKIWGISEDGSYNKNQGKEAFEKWLHAKLTNTDFDVLGFHRRMNKYHRTYLLTAAERFHPSFMIALKYLIKKSGISVSLKTPFKYVTLMNYQIAKKDVYLEYVEKVLKPVVNVMMDEKDKQLQKWLFSDSGYEGDAKYNNTLQRISGTNHYTMHTFILERLFTIFLNDKNFKCINY